MTQTITMAGQRNAFLEASASDDSDSDQGYDSEAAELSKGGRLSTSERAPKRRKLSDVESVLGSDDHDDDDFPAINTGAPDPIVQIPSSSTPIDASPHTVDNLSIATATSLPTTTEPHNPTPTSRSAKKAKKKRTPGVVYLSSLPPYLRPSALRNLLTQRGFEPITRLFLAPASKPTRASKSSSTSTKPSSKRQRYSEGWIEFVSKTTAKRCASTLNAAPVGGKKGGFYRDDVWNMKYLRGMRWEELMAGVREERREEEGRRDEERLVLARETRRFVEGVERGREMKGMEGSRAKKRKKTVVGEEENGERGTEEQLDVADGGEVRRTWRQFEVKGKGRNGDLEAAASKDEAVGEDVKRVLGKIF